MLNISLFGGPTSDVKAVPKLELSGKKWMVEHFVGNRNIQVRTYKFIKKYLSYKTLGTKYI